MGRCAFWPRVLDASSYPFPRAKHPATNRTLGHLADWDRGVVDLANPAHPTELARGVP